MIRAATNEIPPATNVAVSVDEELFQVMERIDPNDQNYVDAIENALNLSEANASRTTEPNTSQDTANNSTTNPIDGNYDKPNWLFANKIIADESFLFLKIDRECYIVGRLCSKK